METNELKRIWQALSEEELVSESLAKENIERLISQKGSNLIISLTKKLRQNIFLTYQLHS